ncbi:hypothetical protein ACIP5Y_36545 [Nocardia sp. NPDC088792]
MRDIDRPYQRPTIIEIGDFRVETCGGPRGYYLDGWPAFYYG